MHAPLLEMRPYEHYNDQELVRLLLTTRDEALRAALCEEFCHRFQPVIAVTVRRRILRRMRWVDHTLVENLVQDTFFKICKDSFKVLRPDNFEFRHANALRSFLKVIADNVVRDHGRKPNVDEVELDETFSDRSDLIGDLERRDRLQKIEHCLQQLSGKPNFPRDYKAFWLHNRDGLTAQEIFLLPDIGFNTVKGVESLLLRLNRWIIQCVRRTNGKKS